MESKRFFEMVRDGARPVILFTEDAAVYEGYAEVHMRARVVSVVEDSSMGCFQLTVNFEEFDAYNQQFETASYFDENQVPRLTAREAGCYKPVDWMYVSLDGELCGFTVEDSSSAAAYSSSIAQYQRYKASGSSLAYVQWLEGEVARLLAVLGSGEPAEPTTAGDGGRSHKQVLVMRKDLKMRTGKLAAQAAHASLAAVLSRAEPVEVRGQRGFFLPLDRDIGPWLEGHFTKIALGVDSEEAARALYEKAASAGLPCALIVDSGLTEFRGVPTVTGVGIGPALVEVVDTVSGHLPLNL